MKYQKLRHFLQNVGKDPAALIFKDELTHLNNRRYLFSHFKHDIDWQKPADFPLSLLMTDIDKFKRVNDQYGKNAGDQALIHIAGLMESAGGEQGLCIRYAGDEFMLLLPKQGKAAALQYADTIIARLEANPFFLAEAGKQIELNLNIGVATAPDDAKTGKHLINQAETALYHAKNAGRNQYADAAKVSRQAIRYVDSAGIVGRKAQFEKVSGALQKVSDGFNQFVIIHGAPGMGKTSFLDTVQRNLEKAQLNPVRVTGAVQESFRAYYLLSYILIVLMNQKADKGMGVLEQMDQKDLSYLPYILPQLADEQTPLPENGPAERDALFHALSRFLSKLVGNHPLVLLIDDLHFSDPASLHLIRELIVDSPSLFFICATASVEKQDIPQTVPLDLFRTAYSEEIGIKDISLTPLNANDIRKYINIIFPGIAMPRELTTELAQLTQGNPLFVIEILRKMISDQKIIQDRHQWTVAELEKGYFPRSFEEIIQQKLDCFDNHSKQFLDRASAFGESTSLSMLTGISQEQTAQINDILKEAVKHGIVRSEFQDNDENIRFSNKRVREVIYDGIEPEERKKLHEEIGEYQEKLYQQDLLPSPAFLVHHFKHAENPEKAQTYEELLQTYNQQVYDFSDDPEAQTPPAEETGPEEDRRPEGAEEIADQPLSDPAEKQVPRMLRALIVAIRNLRLYPPDSKSVTGAIDELIHLVAEILSTDEAVSIIAENGTLRINGQHMDVSAYQSIAEKIVEFWDRLELKSLTFQRGVEEQELKAVLEKISHIDRKTITPGFWERFSEDNQLEHVIPRQVKYTKLDAGIDALSLEEPQMDAADTTPPPDEPQLEAAELHAIFPVIASLLGAYNKLRLYPARGPVARQAIEQVITELEKLLDRWSALTIARVGNALLINGAKVDTAGFETLAQGFLQLLSDAGLNSITFLPGISGDEMVDFLSTTGQRASENLDTAAWQKLAAKKQITKILFDQNIYGVIDSRAGAAEGTDTAENDETAADGQEQASSALEMVNPDAPASSAQDVESLPQQIRALFLKGDLKGAEALVLQLCEDFRKAGEPKEKNRITEQFYTLLNPDDWRPSAAFLKLVLTPAAHLLTPRNDEKVPDKLLDCMQQSAQQLILLGEYRLATWVYTQLQQARTRISDDSRQA
ncbi:MAG: diguanylate cyclase domain-containing protein, partial [Thermodesulfobacteriota bacterium]